MNDRSSRGSFNFILVRVVGKWSTVADLGRGTRHDHRAVGPHASRLRCTMDPDFDREHWALEAERLPIAADIRIDADGKSASIHTAIGEMVLHAASNLLPLLFSSRLSRDICVSPPKYPKRVLQLGPSRVGRQSLYASADEHHCDDNQDSLHHHLRL